jgi:hypothetical protein
MGGERKCVQNFDGEITSKASTQKTEKATDKITINLKEIVCEDGKWIQLAQDHVQQRLFILAVSNFRVPLPQSA